MSVEETLKERGSRYGDFSDHAKIAQALQKVMHTSLRESPVKGHPEDFRVKSWDCLPDIHKQALTVIADKIARILSGDPCYIDNFRDIAGYATLVMRSLESLDGATDTKTIQIRRKNGKWEEE